MMIFSTLIYKSKNINETFVDLFFAQKNYKVLGQFHFGKFFESFRTFSQMFIVKEDIWKFYLWRFPLYICVYMYMRINIHTYVPLHLTTITINYMVHICVSAHREYFLTSLRR